MLLVFTQDNVSTWEVRRQAEKVEGGGDVLVIGGTADTFDAAKAAALFEATARSLEMNAPAPASKKKDRF
jgi:hypothetical protein